MFDGAQGKFQIRWTRFVAYAGVIGFVLALQPHGKPTMPDTDAEVLDEVTPKGAAYALAKKRSAAAMVNLTMAFLAAGTMALVYEAMNNLDYPGGLAHEVVTVLKKKYMPQDMMTCCCTWTGSDSNILEKVDRRLTMGTVNDLKLGCPIESVLDNLEKAVNLGKAGMMLMMRTEMESRAIYHIGIALYGGGEK